MVHSVTSIIRDGVNSAVLNEPQPPASFTRIPLVSSFA